MFCDEKSNEPQKLNLDDRVFFETILSMCIRAHDVCASKDDFMKIVESTWDAVSVNGIEKLEAAINKTYTEFFESARSDVLA